MALFLYLFCDSGISLIELSSLSLCMYGSWVGLRLYPTVCSCRLHVVLALSILGNPPYVGGAVRGT